MMKSMKFAQKLRNLLSDKSQSEISKTIGVGQTAVSRYLQGATPASDVGIKLAKALNVDPDWLFDDDQPIDVPKTRGTSLTNSEFVAELERRALELAGRIDKVLTLAESYDWKRFTAELDAKGWGKIGNIGGQWESDEDRLKKQLDREQILAIELATSTLMISKTPEFKVVSCVRSAREIARIDERVSAIIETVTSSQSGTNALLTVKGYVFKTERHLELSEGIANQLGSIVAHKSTHAKPTKKQSKE